jgi:hypothetical protein
MVIEGILSICRSLVLRVESFQVVYFLRQLVHLVHVVVPFVVAFLNLVKFLLVLGLQPAESHIEVVVALSVVWN